MKKVNKTCSTCQFKFKALDRALCREEYRCGWNRIALCQHEDTLANMGCEHWRKEVVQ